MPVQYDPREEKEILQDEQSWLQHRLNWIKGRIEQIDKPSEE
jgi:hypothetical protein